MHYYVFVVDFIDAVFCYICSNAGNPACGETPNLTVLKTEPCTGG